MKTLALDSNFSAAKICRDLYDDNHNSWMRNLLLGLLELELFRDQKIKNGFIDNSWKAKKDWLKFIFQTKSRPSLKVDSKCLMCFKETFDEGKCEIDEFALAHVHYRKFSID